MKAEGQQHELGLVGPPAHVKAHPLYRVTVFDDELGSVLHVAVRTTGVELLVSVTGELDGSTEYQLRSVLDEAWSGPSRRPVIVDLTGLSFFGSGGISDMLVATERAARETRFLGYVVGNNRSVVRPLSVIGLLDRLPIYATVQQAKAAATPDDLSGVGVSSL
ncbi:anti-sigma factor antagonist [Pseudonocardia sp. ICBG1293]|uniref:anti-sigma factor antagonist n=1 Tax=Pseudonocardia sp. ICBG1293 TaxID=2844382 RepID=UPI001CC9CD30|nr:anti-sigma factor antagonist [Pseudonocardia sp. ICBG1293]